MARIPNTVPITDLRQSATAIVGQPTASGKPVVITQRGRAAAVEELWMRD